VVQLESSYRSKLAGYLDAGDATGLDAYLRTIAGKDFLPQLRTTPVPTLAIAAWQDVWMDPSGVLAAFTSLPATTPKRLFLTTGQHGTPVNDRELQRQIRLTQSWFERFLKDHHEPVELGPPILASLAPADRAGYADRSNLWRQRAEVAYPPADVRAQRHYLRSRGRLRPEAASKGEVYDVVQNTVASGYTPRSFQADGGSPSLVLKKVPLSRFGYETEALDEDLELAGFPKVSLALEPSARNFLIAVRLVAIAPDDSERVLTSGARLVRLASSPAPMRLAFELGAVGTVVPRGYALRLEVGNHDLHQALATDVFRRLPHFGNSTVRVVHDGNSEQSWLELPVRDRVQPDLASASAAISVTAPGTQTLVVRSSLDWKGSAYIVVLGLSGQGPPVPLAQGSRLWLVPDDLTLALMGVVNRPGLEGFLGVLDAQGRATSRLDLGRLPSLPVDLVGQFLQICPIVAGPALGPTAGAGIRLRFE
jgi:predicted acyl esterase